MVMDPWWCFKLITVQSTALHYQPYYTSFLCHKSFKRGLSDYLCPPVFLSLPFRHSSPHTIISDHHQIRPFFFSSITPLCLLADILSGPLAAYLPSTLWVYTLKSWLPLTVFFKKMSVLCLCITISSIHSPIVDYVAHLFHLVILDYVL